LEQNEGERVMRKRKKLLFAVLTCLMIFACGAITVFAADGGKEYVRRYGNKEDWEKLSEIKDL